VKTREKRRSSGIRTRLVALLVLALVDVQRRKVRHEAVGVCTKQAVECRPGRAFVGLDIGRAEELAI